MNDYRKLGTERESRSDFGAKAALVQ